MQPLLQCEFTQHIWLQKQRLQYTEFEYRSYDNYILSNKTGNTFELFIGTAKVFLNSFAWIVFYSMRILPLGQVNCVLASVFAGLRDIALWNGVFASSLRLPYKSYAALCLGCIVGHTYELASEYSMWSPWPESRCERCGTHSYTGWTPIPTPRHQIKRTKQYSFL